MAPVTHAIGVLPSPPMSARRYRPVGTFRVWQFSSGDPYELSYGHPIYCAPTGGRGAMPNALGASVVGSDPAVQQFGVDAGYTPRPDTLRAPDVSVGNVPDEPGWIHGVPSLAIEYADVGQNEEKLQEKIADLIGAGTKFLWVVRLVGPRRVEVHRPDERMVTVLPGELLTAPGVLKNAVPIEALYEKSAADRATLTNLLQRQGFEDLETVLSQGRDEGALVQARRSLRRVLARRKLSISAQIEARIEQCVAIGQLEEWQDHALEAKSASDVFAAA
jgi:Uma2 family endonuclease